MSSMTTSTPSEHAAKASVPIAKKRVQDWMSSNPITVLPTTHIREAWQLMGERRIRRLPVVENGKLVGIVTIGDLRSAGADTDGDEATKMRVDSVFHADPIIVMTDTTLLDAARLMLQHKVSGLPVLSTIDRSLVGIITESDIFRAFIADQA
jgi:CBS domain-containing protein